MAAHLDSIPRSRSQASVQSTRRRRSAFSQPGHLREFSTTTRLKSFWVISRYFSVSGVSVSGLKVPALMAAPNPKAWRRIATATSAPATGLPSASVTATVRSALRMRSMRASAALRQASPGWLGS